MATSQVTVKIYGGQFPFPIQSGETVYDLKIKIEYFARINREEQLLLLGPNPLIMDHKTLSLYGVVNKSVIDLHQKHKDVTFQVTVISKDGVLMDTIISSAYDNVLKIKEHIEIKVGVFSGRQSLLFHDAELCNSDLLRDFSVTLFPTMTLVLNPRYVEAMFDVRILDGKNGRLITEVSVHPNDRVFLLDWTVRRLDEMRGRSFRLYYRGKTPVGLEMLEALDVRSNAVFHVMLNN